MSHYLLRCSHLTPNLTTTSFGRRYPTVIVNCELTQQAAKIDNRPPNNRQRGHPRSTDLILPDHSWIISTPTATTQDPHLGTDNPSTYSCLSRILGCCVSGDWVRWHLGSRRRHGAVFANGIRKLDDHSTRLSDIEHLVHDIWTQIQTKSHIALYTTVSSLGLGAFGARRDRDGTRL